ALNLPSDGRPTGAVQSHDGAVSSVYLVPAPQFQDLSRRLQWHSKWKLLPNLLPGNRIVCPAFLKWNIRLSSTTWLDSETRRHLLLSAVFSCKGFRCCWRMRQPKTLNLPPPKFKRLLRI